MRDELTDKAHGFVSSYSEEFGMEQDKIVPVCTLFANTEYRDGRQSGFLNSYIVHRVNRCGLFFKGVATYSSDLLCVFFGSSDVSNRAVPFASLNSKIAACVGKLLNFCSCNKGWVQYNCFNSMDYTGFVWDNPRDPDRVWDGAFQVVADSVCKKSDIPLDDHDIVDDGLPRSAAVAETETQQFNHDHGNLSGGLCQKILWIGSGMMTCAGLVKSTIGKLLNKVSDSSVAVNDKASRSDTVVPAM